MRWRYDQRLVEAVVFQEVERREAGRFDVAHRYHALISPIYEMPQGRNREEAFFEVHWKMFVEFGFDKIIEAVSAGYPLVPEHVPEGLVVQASSANEEGAELFAREGHYTVVAMRLLPARFLDREDRLVCFLNHELCHISDMLDATFRYRRDDLSGGGLSSFDTQLVRERYRLLWSISVDGRLSKVGEAPYIEREMWWAQFKKAFPFVSLDIADSCFRRLWKGPRPSHEELLWIALEPRANMSSGGYRMSAASSIYEKGDIIVERQQGQKCPLCLFPSHEWVEACRLGGDVVAQIKKEFPLWREAGFICGRCVEVYTVQHEPLKVA